MAYIGKKVEETELDNRTVDTMTGDGSDTTMSLSATPISVNNVLVFLNGVMQRPTTDFTLSGSTITFAAAPFTGAVVVAITGEGGHIGRPSSPLPTEKFMNSAVTSAKISGVAATKLTGALPALDGAALTGGPQAYTESTSDPTINTNPSTGVGTFWVNKSSGEAFCLTDATANANVWTNVGLGTGHVAIPSNPNNTGGFTSSLSKNSSYNFTFSGATDVDDNNVTHYVVDTISNAALTVTSAEVAAGSAHAFSLGNLGSDGNITFRVRSKDSGGRFSAGITVTFTGLSTSYTTATGGTITTVGNYKVHTFLANGTFTISQIGDDANLDYLVVAGGGAGGNSLGGGGGAGGLRNSFNNETSGGGGSSETNITGTAQAYQIAVGGGGVRGGSNATPSTITPTSGTTITTVGGGNGGDYDNGSGNAGGSGGGGNGSGSGGAGTANQGYRGGLAAVGSNNRSAGGGGAGAVGAQNQGNSSPAGAGGVGVQSNIDGNNHYWAGGGGGANYEAGGGNGGLGGGGGGSQRTTPGSPGTGGGSAKNSGANGTTSPGADGGNAGANTGGGGGGGVLGDPVGVGGNGGSGVVIVRYKFQN